MNNRSMPQCSVIPELVYADVERAIEWLGESFGLRLRWRAGDHRAQLAIGEGAIVVVESREDLRLARPFDRSHSVMVRVEDVDAHHRRSIEAGAPIVHPPADFPYGERQYTADDLGGHRWTFTETIADVPPEQWGGSPGEAIEA